MLYFLAILYSVTFLLTRIRVLQYLIKLKQKKKVDRESLITKNDNAREITMIPSSVDNLDS